MLNTKTFTGLYIGDDSVECAVLKGTLKGPKLIKFGRVAIYPENISDNDKEKAKDHYIVDAIRKVLKENDIKPINVVFAIPSEDVMVRYFNMPKIPKSEWNTAVNFEATRYIPLRIEEVASDFQVLQSLSSSENMDVVFVAARKNIIARFIGLLGKAGVKPTIIEPAPFSLMRAFHASGQVTSNENILIINVDIKTITVSILRKCIPYMVRNVSLDEKISLDKPLAEDAFGKIISDVKLLFDFYKKQFPSENVDKIIIDGLGPLEDLQHAVGKELSMPVVLGDPSKGIDKEKDLLPPRLSIAFGLALRGLLKPFLDLNLRAEGLLDYRQKEKFLKILYLEASVAVVLLIILKLVFIKALEPFENQLNLTLSVRPKVTGEITAKTDSVSRMRKLENDIEKKIHTLESIIPKRTYVTERLDELTELVPNNLWLTELDFQEKLDEKDPLKVVRHFSINGYCIIGNDISGKNVVRDFLTELEASNTMNNGMRKSRIVSIERAEIKGEKAASFKILFEGP